jgi:hypothetical protein
MPKPYNFKLTLACMKKQRAKKKKKKPRIANKKTQKNLTLFLRVGYSLTNPVDEPTICTGSNGPYVGDVLGSHLQAPGPTLRATR